MGKEIALSFAEKNYHIALHYHHSHDEAKATAQQIKRLGVECELFPCDLANTDTLCSFIEDVFKVFPQCNTLVNNASIFQQGTFEATDSQLLHNHFAINFYAPFFLTQSFAKYCPQDGNVVNMIDSYITKYNSPYFGYLLSKKALADFTKMAAHCLSNIRVNAVCPGIIKGYSNDLSDHFIAQKEQLLPIKKIPQPRDITDAIHILINSPKMTGQLIYIDSGEHLI